MKSWAKLLLLGAAAAAVAEVAVRQVRGRAPEGAAPAFALPDLDGKEVSLERLRGRVVAVNFWASWCGPCREEIPDLVRVYAANRSRCFEMLGVAEESGGLEAVSQAARELGITYPVLLDEQGRAGDAFRIPGYPRTYVIDHAGQIRATFDGAVSRRELESALDPLLAAAPKECRPAM